MSHFLSVRRLRLDVFRKYHRLEETPSFSSSHRLLCSAHARGGPEGRLPRPVQSSSRGRRARGGPRQAGHGRQHRKVAPVPPTGECTRDPGWDAWWSGPGWGCEWHLGVVTTTTMTTTANRYLREVEVVLRSLSGQTPPCTHTSDLCTTHRPKRAHSMSIVLR